MSKTVQNNKDPLQKRKNMKKDFKQFFIETAGSSLVQQGEFQQISENDENQNKFGKDASDDEFVLEEDIQPQRGIKTAQFWSGMKMGSNALGPSNEQVYLQVCCPISFGFNSLGRDNILYLDGVICKAVGCLIIYGEEFYSKHSQKITTLSYNSSMQQLLSATESSAPQLFLWKVNLEDQQLQWQRRFFIGKKCEGIYATSFFKNQFVIAVEKFTFHKSSILHCFDKKSAKKQASLKIAKFYDLEILKPPVNHDQNQDQEQSLHQISQEERVFFANDEGIHELILDQKKTLFQTKLIHQLDSVTCLCPFYEDAQNLKFDILYGSKQGCIQLSFSKNSLKVHEGWIFQIKNQIYNGINYFFCLGAIDCNFSIIEYNLGKFNICHKIYLGGYGRSIQSQNDMLLIGKRDGKYEEFSINKLISQKNQSQIGRKETLSLNCFESKQNSKQFLFGYKQLNKKNQEKKRFVYGNSGCKNITFFKIQQNKMIDISPYNLRSYPSTLDLNQNLIAYTYDVNDKDEGTKYIKSFGTIESKIINSKEKQFQKTILVIQDYVKKDLILKKSFEVENDQRLFEKKCTAIKFSKSGKYLALGNEEGQVYLLKVDQKQSLDNIIKSSTKMHKQAISELIWDQQERYLKTVTMSQLFYWKLSEQKNNNKFILKLSSTKPSEVKDTKWNMLGKFSWEVKSIWENTSFINEIYKFWPLIHTKMEIKQNKLIKQVQTSKEQVIVCSTVDGNLRIYNYPANSSKFLQFKTNNSLFQVCQFINSDDRYSFLVVIEGILMVIQLRK